VTLRRRAFAQLRDKEAVSVLFDELAERFADRQGGYTRVVRIAAVRLGDAGKQALIEFVGERDRVSKTNRQAPMVVDDGADSAPASDDAAASSTDEEESTADAAPQTGNAEATASDDAPADGDAESEEKAAE
jgi:large subunit ribosomal protein L17